MNEPVGLETSGPEPAGPESSGPELSGPEPAGPELAGPESDGPEPAGTPPGPIKCAFASHVAVIFRERSCRCLCTGTADASGRPVLRLSSSARQ